MPLAMRLAAHHHELNDDERPVQVVTLLPLIDGQRELCSAGWQGHSAN
jgi:hypothetical protein